jgi:beta-xylosidase
LRSEPNDNFWKGGQDGYFELYRQAARALKAASSRLKVGGPATCCADCWIGDFVRHMDNHSVPYDFISTHAYSSCELDPPPPPPSSFSHSALVLLSAYWLGSDHRGVVVAVPGQCVTLCGSNPLH